MFKKCLFLLITATVVLLLSGGCGFAEGGAGTHPLFKKGKSEQEKGNYVEAVKYFKRYLAVRPDSGKTHLLLATIYDENMDLQVDAIYHYQEFIRISRNSSEAQNVQKWIATARHKYYLKMKSKFNDPEEIAALQDELSVSDNKYQMVIEEKKKLLAFFDENKKNMMQLNTQNNILLAEKEKNEAELVIAQEKQKQLEADIKQLQARSSDELAKAKSDNETTNKNLASLKEQHKSLQAEMEKISLNKNYIPNNEGEKPVLKTPAASTAATIVKNVETPPAQEVTGSHVSPPAVAATPPVIDQGYQSEMQKIRFYTVKSGDTLTKISKQFYGTTKYYRMIMDENKLGADEENKMKPGAVLKIPPLKNN